MESIYFFILYHTRKKENSNDINFIISENNNQIPKCIYCEEYQDKIFNYKKIFKVNKSTAKGKKANNYYFEFDIGDDKYSISFEVKGITFVYDVIVEKGKKIIQIKRKIKQNIEYQEKLKCFLKALKDNNEENKIDLLYKDSIDLYSRKKGFTFLIELFIKIYEKKDLCPKLLEKFKEINKSPKDNEKNMDRKSNLKELKSIFNKIIDDADTIIEKNNYSAIEFYGIILCYLNFYDDNKFSSVVDKLFKSNSNNLYEVLLIYNSHFFFPINQNFNFLNEFIKYIIENKEFIYFEKGLSYIRDIETYLNIIEKNKEEIYKKYLKNEKNYIKHIIKLEQNLTLVRKDSNSDKSDQKLTKEENISNLEIVEKNIKEKIAPIRFNGNNKSIKQITEENNSSIENSKENESVFKIINNIKLIIDFSNKNNTFLVYFTNDFWKYILKFYNEPNQNNIYICFKLREIFLKYHELVNKQFKEKDEKKFTIKKDANNYFEVDEFAFLLDLIIRRYINTNTELTNIEKLAFITQYNPYYLNKNPNKIDTNIFDLFDLNNIDNDFIDDFKDMNFEIIFERNLSEYINKIISKIKEISNFDKVIKLINIDNIQDKNIFLNSLAKKYDNIIKDGLEKDLDKAVHIIANLAIIFFTYEVDEKKKFNFITNKIKKLDEDIFHKILIEIMRIYINKNKNDSLDEEVDMNEDNSNEQEEFQDKVIDDDEKKEEEDDFKKIKEFIFEEFANNLDKEKDIDNIFSLIDCLLKKPKNEEDVEKNGKGTEEEDRKIIDKNKKENKEIINEFLHKLMEKNLFKKEEFFSAKKNIKILLLIKLNEKKILQNNINSRERNSFYQEEKKEEYSDNIKDLIKDIKKELDGEINKKKFDEFLNIDESIIKQRLSLLNIIYENFNSNDEYQNLKKIKDGINKDIDQLKDIKDNIILYHKETYKSKINELIEIIKDNQNKKIKDYKGGKIENFIRELANIKEIVDNVKKVSNLLLFNVIYEDMNIKDEVKHFDDAYAKLNNIGKLLNKKVDITKLYNEYKDIFDKIKEKLSINEKRAQEFIGHMISYYEIKDEHLIDELTILFKIKKYEMDINSIFFFFKFFEKNNDKWNESLSQKYQNLSKNNFDDIKTYLNELKEKDLYDYKNIKYYNKLFTCLYDKKEAVDFLFSKEDQKIEKIQILYDRIQPTDRTINIKDIEDTEKCISIFNNMKNFKDNFKIFEYIKGMSEKEIAQFENYSRIYPSIIELDRNDDISENLYEQVNNYIKDATFNISQDTEDFNLEELIHLKNKIHLQNENGKNKLPEEIINPQEKKLKSKCEILKFFKEIMYHLEIVNEYMKVLRAKGSSLPIKISIKTSIQENIPSVKYYLDDKNKKFEEIRDFLFKAKNSYIAQLNKFYKEKLNIRFLYGKQFRSVMKYLESGYNIDSFLRYILNQKGNKSIEEGYKAISRNVKDYVSQYELYNKNSLDSISNYITTIFLHNGISLEDHYEKMKIKFTNSIHNSLTLSKQEFKVNDNPYKGIILHECENNSMERFIINLFWDKVGELPIAQNVLITSKETSSEEIQAFFHRAILCNYNTLFVVEINDSFSDYQLSIMNSYIDNLLSEKYKRIKEETKEDIDKIKTGSYLDSCIVFIYDNQNKNIKPFLNEIGKYEKLDILKEDNIIKNIPKIENIMVITSDICGLGKSKEIQKMILKNKKNYFHFPLGGILSKSIIFEKLDNLLNKIEHFNKENNTGFQNIAIHLDLIESEETSIINEFFFSFLITKFYIDNENIIYIPKDIDIYVEIPNCFNNYLSKFGLLNIFQKHNINIGQMPNFNYSEKIIKIFTRMLGYISNNEIEEYVKTKIGLTQYSYHQIDIFIKLMISQYSKFDTKLKFVDNYNNDVTKQCIEKFAKCTKYFTNGGFAKLLTEKNDNNEKDYIDKLSEIYDNDLKNIIFESPLIFTNKEKSYDELYIPSKDSKEYKNSKDFLSQIKRILDLPNEVEEDVKKDNIELKSLLSIIEEENNNYVITIDNFKKMVLLVYRIKANIPVIIMGETGCGKTALITKLNQILNNGIKKVQIINIHPGINDEKICKEMEEKDKIAKNQNDEELWIFFDEINTCSSLSLLTEIFINRTYNGKSFSDNIRLIGACNPYRKRKGKGEKCGLSISDDNDKELVYLVQPLPQSLLYYVFSFGSIDENDEKKYIHSIIENLFIKDEDLHLHNATTEVMSYIFTRNF